MPTWLTCLAMVHVVSVPLDNLSTEPAYGEGGGGGGGGGWGGGEREGGNKGGWNNSTVLQACVKT